MEISALINKQKMQLSYELENTFKSLAYNCESLIGINLNTDNLDRLLHEFIQQCEYANLIYVLDSSGLQLSSNIDKNNISINFRGQDLSSRTFFSKVTNDMPLYMSDTYISSATLKPCISVSHAIFSNNSIIGVLVMDLSLSKLPLIDQQMNSSEFIQIKGDPEIRSNLFNQKRVESAMDKSIDTVHNISNVLLCELGVFHLKLHYASSRATIWTYDDPYNYRLHILDEITNPDICLLYPQKPYPSEAKVTQKQIKKIFSHFYTMRFMDENLYLKTASLNIINGMVGLSFSCDGNHYLPVDEFLRNFEKVYA